MTKQHPLEEKQWLQPGFSLDYGGGSSNMDTAIETVDASSLKEEDRSALKAVMHVECHASHQKEASYVYQLAAAISHFPKKTCETNGFVNHFVWQVKQFRF